MTEFIFLLAYIHCESISEKKIDFNLYECQEVVSECLLDDEARYCLDEEKYKEIHEAYYD